MDLNELIIQEIIDSQKEKMDSDFKEKLKIELSKKEKEMKDLNQIRIEKLNSDLNEKTKSLQDYTKIQIENERMKRDFDLVLKKSELEIERAKSVIEREKSISEKYELQLAEKEKQMEEVKKSAKDAVQKANQGSIQLQGEVQEDAIENWLLNNYPLDKIHEVKKGAMGADCLQVVNEFDNQNCGSIYYESKNTKEFNPKWISKFKKDLQSKNADIGVIITKSYPKNQNRMRVVDGIYMFLS